VLPDSGQLLYHGWLTGRCARLFDVSGDANRLDVREFTPIGRRISQKNCFPRVYAKEFDGTAAGASALGANNCR
jgi:hypothetical protein